MRNRRDDHRHRCPGPGLRAADGDRVRRERALDRSEGRSARDRERRRWPCRRGRDPGRGAVRRQARATGRLRPRSHRQGHRVLPLVVSAAQRTRRRDHDGRCVVRARRPDDLDAADPDGGAPLPGDVGSDHVVPVVPARSAADLGCAWAEPVPDSTGADAGGRSPVARAQRARGPGIGALRDGEAARRSGESGRPRPGRRAVRAATRAVRHSREPGELDGCRRGSGHHGPERAVRHRHGDNESGTQLQPGARRGRQDGSGTAWCSAWTTTTAAPQSTMWAATSRRR